MPPFSLFLFGALWLIFFLEPVLAGECPHCFGTLSGCTFSVDKRCPVSGGMDANTAVVAAGVGALTLTNLIRPRFMRMFSRVSFETILALVKRSEPGTGFTIEKDTKTPTILTAISNGRITFENAVIRLCELVEDESDATAIAVLTRRLDCLKTACDIHHKSGEGSQFTSLFQSGILCFLWALVSESVMVRDMKVKLNAVVSKASENVSRGAKLMRPKLMEEFAEMLNLFTMYLAALGIAGVLVVTSSAVSV